MIVAVPAVAPAVTVPVDEPIVASPLLLHVPPAVASVNVTFVPAHSEAAPWMGVGLAFTVTGRVVTQPPSVYEIVAVPV